MGALPYSLLQPGEGRCLREAVMLSSSTYRNVRSPPLLTASGHMMVSDLTTWPSTLVSLCHSMPPFFTATDEWRESDAFHTTFGPDAGGPESPSGSQRHLN